MKNLYPINLFQHYLVREFLIQFLYQKINYGHVPILPKKLLFYKIGFRWSPFFWKENWNLLFKSSYLKWEKIWITNSCYSRKLKINRLQKMQKNHKFYYVQNDLRYEKKIVCVYKSLCLCRYENSWASSRSRCSAEFCSIFEIKKSCSIYPSKTCD